MTLPTTDTDQELRPMERILVVEDDAFFRGVFRDLLREEGYEVDVAASGAEALEMLQNLDYQVVVTDLVMEDISGLELLSRVKQNDPAIEVIMVTGHANVETAIYALKNGARDYLVKPINHDELKHTVALCFEQRRLLDENLELKELINLFQVSQTIANCLEMERIYTLVVDALAKEAGVSRGIGYFPEPSGDLAVKEVKGLDGVSGENLGELLLPHVQRLQEESGNVFSLVDDRQVAGVLSRDRTEDIHEAMLLFIRSKSHLQGVVVLFNEPGSGLRNDINYKNLHFLLDQSALAFDNAARYATARNLVNIDELTGLFNYRYLGIAFDREIRRAERYGFGVSIIFMDLDLFKNVNDTHGHLVGSKVLKEVGMLLIKSTREVDYVFRYGGDEFTIILVETGKSVAANVAERIRKSIESNVFLADEGYSIKLTACLGYACYPEDSKAKVELLELSDRAMYHGKASGKNVVFHAAME
jgi:two-component system, cell cycle response regulator